MTVESLPELESRPYQRATSQALHRAWNGERRPSARTKDHAAVNRPAVVLPTGTGKTVVFSHEAGEVFRAGGRTLVLVHRDELADQAADKLHMAAPGAKVGIVKASRNETNADIVVASVQTLQNVRRREMFERNAFSLGIADECHHAASPSWMTTMAYFGAFRKDDIFTRWAGFTATLARNDKRGLGEVWQEVAYTYSIQQAIGDGYLVSPVGRRIQVESLELASVKRSRGDFQVGDLGDALSDAGAPKAAVAALLEHAPERRTAAFWPTVATAQEFADLCNESGIPAALITGDTPRAERRQAYDDFRTGAVRVLATAMVLTEGWDAPWCDCVLIARPTNSRSLYVQMVGRGLRPWAPGGKTDCLVLDLMGASERNTLETLEELLHDAEEDEAKEPRPVNDVDPDDLDENGLYLPDGPIRATDVDLFAGRSSVWLQTEDRQWWFIPVPGAVFFLYPQTTGTYALGYKRLIGPPAQVLEKDLTMEYAMAWAERYAKEHDGKGMFGTKTATRGATWRKNNSRPSEFQVDEARSIGLDDEFITSANKVQLSDLISVRKATVALRRVA